MDDRQADGSDLTGNASCFVPSPMGSSVEDPAPFIAHFISITTCLPCFSASPRSHRAGTRSFRAITTSTPPTRSSNLSFSSSIALSTPPIQHCFLLQTQRGPQTLPIWGNGQENGKGGSHHPNTVGSALPMSINALFKTSKTLTNIIDRDFTGRARQVDFNCHRDRAYQYEADARHPIRVLDRQESQGETGYVG